MSLASYHWKAKYLHEFLNAVNTRGIFGTIVIKYQSTKCTYFLLRGHAPLAHQNNNYYRDSEVYRLVHVILLSLCRWGIIILLLGRAIQCKQTAYITILTKLGKGRHISYYYGELLYRKWSHSLRCQKVLIINNTMWAVGKLFQVDLVIFCYRFHIYWAVLVIRMPIRLNINWYLDN